MRRPAVNDQKNLVLGPDHEPPEKLNEHIGIDAAFLLDHEPHMAARGDRRDQAHAIPRPCTRYNGGLPLPAPGATRMMIRAHVRGVAEVNLSLFPLRQSFDPWEYLLEPLLHQSFVPFQRTMQRLLAGDAELSQKPPDRHQAQRDIEFIFDQRCHHLARPQRKCELELQRILLRHRVVNPLQLLAVKFRRTPKQRLGLQRSPAATPILRQPTIDRRTIDAENISNNFRAFTILNTAHSTLTHRLQCGVIQSARIVCPHAQRESYSRRHVKKSMLTYVLINNVARRFTHWLGGDGGGNERQRGADRPMRERGLSHAFAAPFHARLPYHRQAICAPFECATSMYFLMWCNQAAWPRGRRSCA